MRITKISVKGLFGMFDHEIPLNQESRITILHGPNGVGKTITLQLLHSSFNYDYESLVRIPFEQLRVDFVGSSYLTVDRVKDHKEIYKRVALLFSYEDGTGKERRSFSPVIPRLTKITNLMRESVKKLRPDLQHIDMLGRDWWSDGKFGVFSKEDMIRKYPLLHTKVYGQLPDWLASIQEEPTIRLISTKRLQRDELTWELLAELEFLNESEAARRLQTILGTYDAVREVSDGLTARIEKLESELTPEGLQKLKRGDVEELSKSIVDANAELDELDNKIEELERENFEQLNMDKIQLYEDIFEETLKIAQGVDELVQSGLSQEFAEKVWGYRSSFKLDVELSSLSEYFFEDIVELGSDVEKLIERGFNQKLAEKIAKLNSAYEMELRVDDLKDDRLDWQMELESLNRLRYYGLSNLFLDIVNERFLFKTLKNTNLDIAGENEFEFIANDGSKIPMSALSSGEQNFLILYYKMLFEVQPNTLVMIDEPELSLNVVWQRRLLKDLQRITAQCKFDVLIATHSPQIIHDRWDWMVPLGSKVDD